MLIKLLVFYFGEFFFYLRHGLDIPLWGWVSLDCKVRHWRNIGIGKYLVGWPTELDSRKIIIILKFEQLDNIVNIWNEEMHLQMERRNAFISVVRGIHPDLTLNYLPMIISFLSFLLPTFSFVVSFKLTFPVFCLTFVEHKMLIPRLSTFSFILSNNEPDSVRYCAARRDQVLYFILLEKILFRSGRERERKIRKWR